MTVVTPPSERVTVWVTTLPEGAADEIPASVLEGPAEETPASVPEEAADEASSE